MPNHSIDLELIDSLATQDGLYSSEAVCRIVGVSYRQLDHWCRIGVVCPTTEAHGQGTQRRWSLSDILSVLDRAQRIAACPLPHGRDRVGSRV